MRPRLRDPPSPPRAAHGHCAPRDVLRFLRGGRVRHQRPGQCCMDHRVRPSTWRSNGGLQLGRRGGRGAVCGGTSCYLRSAFAGADTRCAGELGCAAFMRASSRHGSAAGLAACATVRRVHAARGCNCTVPCSSRACCCWEISCVPIKDACESCTALELRAGREVCE